jgi:hypothetical protein
MFTRFRLGLSACLMILALIATAPLFAQSAGTYAAGAGNYGQPFGTKGAHWFAGGAPPPTANAACGTGATVNGTDAAFVLTTGTTSSATCAVTFVAPYAQAPACNVQGESNLASYSVTPAAVTISGVLDSRVYHAQCVARAGGG